MGKINLLIANANNNFSSEEVAIITSASVRAEEFIRGHFTDFDYEVDLVVTAPSFLMNTIPEDGISGRTYNSRLVIIVLDKKQLAISERIIYETICHEMSHSLRWEKLPEYSDNLFKGMILEGLATVLEERALEAREIGVSQYFLETVKSTTAAEYREIISHLEGSFENEKYDYDTIFYTGDDKLPRWAGYRLGYYYVKKYLETTGRSIEEATLDSYSQFQP